MSNDEDQYIYWLHKQRAAGITFLVLGCTFTALRFTVRKVRRENAPWGWDDILIVPSLLSVIALSVLIITVAENGLTLTDEILPNQKLLSAYVASEKASYGSSTMYPFACAFPKLSVAALYLRLFPPNSRASSLFTNLSRLASWGIIVFLVVNCVAFFVPSAAACTPPNAFWSYPPRLQKCVNLALLGTWINLPHIVSDLIMLVIPLPLVLGLHATSRKKLGLTVVFLAGGLGLVGCCARFGIYIYTTYVASSFAQKFRPILDIMTVLEPSMYLIAACLPPLLGFLSHAGFGWFSVAWSSIRRSKRSLGSDSEQDLEAVALREGKFPSRGRNAGGEAGW